MIDTLIEKILFFQNPTVVGLDPREYLIPTHIKEEMYKTYGETPQALAKAYLIFNRAIIDEIYDFVPAVKPQIAFYEELGMDGIETYLKTIAYAKEKDMIVIGDIKRSDIGSTATSYANGHLGQTTIGSQKYTLWQEDFVTINPYLGKDSLEPFVDVCKANKKGIFTLVKTSNKGSGDIQDLVSDGTPVYLHVGKMVEDIGTDLRGKYGFSSIGAVVGATHPEQAKELRKALPHTFFLVPGYGAQGAKGKDIAHTFNSDGIGAIVNSSRGIIGAYQENDTFSEKDFALATRQAALDMQQDLLSHVQMKG